MRFLLDLKYLIALCFSAAYFCSAQDSSISTPSVNTIEQKINVGDLMLDLEPLEALKYYKQAHEKAIQNKEPLNEAICLTKLGNANFILGDFPVALNYQIKALEIYESQKKDSLVAEQLSKIGSVYYFSKQNELDDAFYYYNEAFKKFNTLGYKDQAAFNLNYTGYIVWAKGNKKEALNIHQEALKIFESINNQKGIATCLSDIGFTLNSLGNYKEALEYHFQALLIEQNIQESGMEIPTLNNIGISYQNLGDYKKALEYSLKSLNMAENRNITLRAQEACETLHKTYKKLNDYQNAYKMHLRYKALTDSLNNEAKVKKLTQLKMQHNFEKIEKQREFEQAKKDALREAEVSYQKIVRNSLFIGILLVVALTINVYRNYRLKNISHKELSIKNKVISNQKHEVEVKNKKITDSITYAKRLQNAILPPTKLIKEHLPQSFIYYKPKDIVAGDFYWFEEIDGLIYIAVADCTGHGVPGAMVSMVCHSALNRSLKEFDLRLTNEILDKSRELVINTFDKSEEEVQDGMYIALCCIDPIQRKLYFSGANNPLYFIPGKTILNQEPTLEVIKQDKQPIGKHIKEHAFNRTEIELNVNDTFYLFTDGFADQFGGPKNAKYKYKPFKEFLSSICHLPLGEQESLINQEFNAWKGTYEQIDDVCIIGFRSNS